MLLSTDWFLPHWSTIGLDIPAEKKHCFQRGCRNIVAQMMGGAENYYFIPFTDERVNATREALPALASECGLDTATTQRIEHLCSSRPGRHRHETTAWLFSVVSDQLLADDHLEGSIKATLQHAKAKAAGDNEDFVQHCMNSPSKWDAYIRQLTPEIPASLGDWISVSVLAEAALERALRELDAEQQSRLLARFRAVARGVTGLEDGQLPDSW